MAVAFLYNDNQDFLFLQKDSNSPFLPGHLVPIGGHIEGHEINDPMKACLREIGEETGLLESSINNLALRYIVLRVKDNKEIRIQYVYFGDVAKEHTLVESEEGQLSWINGKKIIDLQVSATTKEIINHYFTYRKSTDQVYVGSMKDFEGEPQITWSILEDWEQQSGILIKD